MKAFGKIFMGISVGLWLLIALILAFTSGSLLAGIGVFALACVVAFLSMALSKVPILGFFVPHIVFFGLLACLVIAMH